MAKPQPKVSDLVEILLQQVNALQKSVDQNNKIQYYLSAKIDKTVITVDTTEMERLNANYSNKLSSDFNNYIKQFEKRNEELLKTSKYFSSKKIGYLVGLNIFLILSTAISMYTAMDSVVVESHYINLKIENKTLQGQVENVKSFFEQNPKTAKMYRKWNKKTQDKKAE